MRPRIDLTALTVMLATSMGCESILGISDHALARQDAATSGALPVESGTADGEPQGDDGSQSDQAAPMSDGAPDGQDGASAPTATVEGGAEASATVTCSTGSLKCNGNTPQACDGGAWSDLSACGGSTPVCSNGACGSYRLTGGITSTTAFGGDAGAVHVVAGGFELGSRSCNAQGVCVSGGIVP